MRGRLASVIALMASVGVAAPHAVASDCQLEKKLLQVLDVRPDRDRTIAVHRMVNDQPTVQSFLETDRGILNMIYGSEWSGTEYSRDSLNLRALARKRVLDAGAGSGGFVKELRTLGIEAEGFDIKYLKRSQWELPPGIFGADIAAIPRPDKSYDVIFSTQSVLSYPSPPALRAKAIHEFRRLLRSDGVIKLSSVDIYQIEQELKQFPDLEIKFLRFRTENQLRPAPRNIAKQRPRSKSDYENVGEVVIAFKEASIPAPKLPASSDFSFKVKVLARLNGGGLLKGRIDFTQVHFSDAEKTKIFRYIQRKNKTVEIRVYTMGGDPPKKIVRGVVTGIEDSEKNPRVHFKDQSGHVEKFPVNYIEWIEPQ